jgi:hypothetical protein
MDEVAGAARQAMKSPRKMCAVQRNWIWVSTSTEWKMSS